VRYRETLRLPVRLETALFRVTQEALSNVRKHAGRTSVNISIGRRADGAVRLEVRDQGRGFDQGRRRRVDLAREWGYPA
jgi:signal transduction histidine kinase